jgi:hypothetical protein
MSGTNKAYQRVDKFKEDDGMFEDNVDNDNSKYSFQSPFKSFQDLGFIIKNSNFLSHIQAKDRQSS